MSDNYDESFPDWSDERPGPNPIPDPEPLEPDILWTGPKFHLVDPLTNGKSIGKVNGGKFILGSGIQAIGDDDRIIYDAGRQLKAGSLTVTLSNYDPFKQRQWGHVDTNGKSCVPWPMRHHIIALSMGPELNHHGCYLDNQGIHLHSYQQSQGKKGFKLMNVRYYPSHVQGGQIICYEASQELWSDQGGGQVIFDPRLKYTLKITWSPGYSRLDINGAKAIEMVDSKGQPLGPGFKSVRYVALMSDLTHSLDRNTQWDGKSDPKCFQRHPCPDKVCCATGCRYLALKGPIYSNLQITEA